MNRAYETADRFCELVKTPNLVTYLHLDENCSSEAAQKALKDRKAYLETVQDLPEYRKEAAGFIRNLETFEKLLSEPEEYVKEVARRKVFKHLPEFKKSVTEFLDTGSLTTEGVAYLRRLALDLGVTMDVFEETLTQMCREAGVKRPRDGEISFAAPVGDFSSENPYKILGASRHASTEALRESYEVNLAAAKDLGDPVASLQAISRVEMAWKTLSNPESRQLFDNEMVSAAGVTAPTAPTRTARKLEPRRRKPSNPAKNDPLRLRPRRILTSPTAKTPMVTSRRADKIQITTAHTQRIKVINKPITTQLTITKTDGKPMFAQVSTDKGWLVAERGELDQNLDTQILNIQINPAELFQPRATGRVVIELETGERINTSIEVEKVSWWSPRTNVPAAIAFVALMGIFIFLAGNLVMVPGKAEGLTIVVDPSSEVVLVNGEKVGKGSFIHYPNPPLGTLQLDVVQSNFAPYRGTVQLEPNDVKEQIVVLKLINPMNFKPSPGMTRDKTIVANEAKIPLRKMNECLIHKTIMDAGESRILIYIGDDGKSNGVEIEGPLSTDSVVKECLTRQAATVSHKPLTGGDYAIIAVYLGEK